jgi:hypothetical protein
VLLLLGKVFRRQGRLPVRLVDTEQKHLEQLITDEAAEGLHLEFKEEFPGNWPDAIKKETLADISAFANAGGGDLIYSIAEAQGSTYADRIVPQQIADVDSEVRRLQDLLKNSVEPRIPGIQIQPVAVVVAGIPGHVMVVRIPQSWVGPHRVIPSLHFFTREGGRKREINVAEIRTLFLRSAGQAQRVRDFRTERLGKILAGETPYKLKSDSVLVMHIVPVQAVFGADAVDPVQYLNMTRGMPVICARGVGETLVNLDGAAGARPVHEGETLGYSLIFRNGFIESTWVLGSRRPEDGPLLAGGVFEDYLAQFVSAVFDELENWGMSKQVIVMLSVLDARKVAVGFQHGFDGPQRKRFDRDVLVVPDMELVGERDLRLELKPLFDLIWQAAGFVGSPHYDAAGNHCPVNF